MILKLCRNIEQGQLSNIAHHIRQYLGAIFEYGLSGGLTDQNPAAAIGKILLPAGNS